MRDSLESQNLDVKKVSSKAFKNQCNDRRHFQYFCTRKKPLKMSEGSKKMVASGGVTQVQNYRMEKTWTLEHERK